MSHNPPQTQAPARPIGRSLDNVISSGHVEEIYTTKKYFEKLRNTNGAHVHGAKDGMPVIEKALGSTKQLGSYRNKPVYSHGTPGKAEDDVFVVGSGGTQGGWIDG